VRRSANDVDGIAAFQRSFVHDAQIGPESQRRTEAFDELPDRPFSSQACNTETARRAIRPAVNGAIGLVVAPQVDAAYCDATVDRLLEDSRNHVVTRVEYRANGSNVNGKHRCAHDASVVGAAAAIIMFAPHDFLKRKGCCSV